VPVRNKVVRDSQYLETWTSERRLRSGIFEVNDYDYEKPNQSLLHTDFGSETYAHSNFEVYEYPGEYKELEAGTRYAQFALEAEQARDHRRQGSGSAASLFAGGTTTLRNHHSGQQNIKYLVLRAMHSYGDQSYRTEKALPSDGTYSGQYEFLPASQPFRAPIVTPKPRIHGAQTAVVVDRDAHGRVDRAEEEIEVEKLTEIYVSFYWDRRQYKEKRSCKVRCAQLWAGKKWGAQFIPRIGMEVVVEFIEGDPDRPLVTGCVYNDANQPPWNLPDQKTISGIKSESTKGGNGFNMWNFEDKKDHEQINVHAQKDLNVKVLNNESRSVGSSMTTTIGYSQTTTIGSGFKPPTGKPSRQTTIKNGDDQLNVESGAILYEAKMKIELKVGPSTLTIDPTGITLNAPTITIKAAGLNTIQGLPVKIN
jgi:type VI secretion system secreted protein VgrG